MSQPANSNIPPHLTKKHPPLPLGVLESMQREIVSESRLGPELEAALRELVRTHPLLNYTWGTGHTFWRGRNRKASERYQDIPNMLWPKPEQASEGRGNLVGESILYIADHIPTVIAEISNAKGNPMQFLALKIRPGKTMRFLPIGELAAIETRGHSLVAKDSESINAIRGILRACPAMKCDG
jgi:hypothetical protein